MPTDAAYLPRGRIRAILVDMNRGRTRHLSTAEAITLLVEFGDAYANAQEHGPSPPELAEQLVKLTNRLFRRLTGKEPSYEDIRGVVPYD